MKTPKIDGLLLSLGQNKNNKNNNQKIDKVVRNVVRSMIDKQSELKYFDQYGNGTVSYSGSIVLISDLTRGTDVTQRIGNEVTIKNVNVKAMFNIHPSEPSVFTRLLLVLDKQGMNLPSVSEILEPIAINTPLAPTAYVTWDYRKRFSILGDKVVLMTQNAFQNQWIEFNVKLNVKCYNIGASTTFKNHVHLIWISNEGNLLTLPGVYWNTRITFSDE